MEAPLVDITPEEPSETNSMLEDYLKGFNEGIGKLVDKEQHPIKENEAEPKETFDMRNENLLLVIDENTDNVKHEAVIRNEMNLKTKEKTSGENIKRSMQEYGDNMESFLKENKNELKEDMKTFIANMDELNKEMDKLLENDDKLQGNIVNQFENKRNRKGAEDSNEQKDSTRREIYLQEKIGNLESNDQRNIFDTSRDFNVIRNFTNHNMTDRFPPDAFSSNLTVLEQTYTLEEYHRRFQKKCKRELKALEAIDIKDLDSHGVNECHAELHDDFNSVPYEYQNFMGMTVTSGIVTIAKDNSNLIGISIGGGAPLCPCLYIVQVFDNTPAAKEGTLQSGDEVVGVNGACVKGKTKVEVAKMIQSVESEVSIKYNKLHADPQQGKSLDIILKKVKHRLVENMSTTTADALGLSRAILCNDTLVKKMEELESTEQMYKGLVDHCKKVLKGFLSLLRTYKDFGDAFAGIGVREPQPRASEAFRQFGEYHRQMEKNGIATIKAVKPILSDLGTYLNKAIPDTKLTIRKYADTKFEYLSYCLKVKEMDDEEYSYAALQEPLYRVETGNYEYRLILRCRQDARLRFAALRSDVLVKLELLDNKHVQDVVCQLQRLIAGLASYHSTNIGLLRDNSLFPIEMDLSQNSFQYECSQVPSYENHGEEEEDRDSRDEELILGEEAKPGDEEEDGQVGGANCHRSEYSDLLRELDESNDSTNLLDLL